MLKNEITLTQCSELIKERFEGTFSESDPDITIEDSPDKRTLFISGKKEAITHVLNLLREEFPSLVVRKSKIGKDAILKGKVIKSIVNKDISIFDLGQTQGILERYTLRPNTNFLVKVETPDMGRRKAIVTSNITITGFHSVLIFNNPNKISQRIKNDQMRKKLYGLARQIKPKNWGILWRTSAKDAIEEDQDILIEEIDRLQVKAEEIMRKYNNNIAPSILSEGTPIVNIEFPANDRLEFDKMRREIEQLYTIKNHHYYKICGYEFGEVVRFAENVVLKEKTLNNMIEKELKDYFTKYYPKINGYVRINHAKVDGRVFHLTPGTLTEYKPEENYMKIHRKIIGSKKRYYDGLNLMKEEGDYAENSFRFGEWYMLTEYFSAKGEKKGDYWNVSTPIEYFPHPAQIYYLDLEIDLVNLPNGEIVVLDEDKLEKAYSEDYISLPLKKKSYAIIEEIKQKVKDQ